MIYAASPPLFALSLPPPQTQLLQSGGVSADVYNLDDKVLVTMDRHLLSDTKEFLFDQDEVHYLTLDKHDMYPKGRRRKD